MFDWLNPSDKKKKIFFFSAEKVEAESGEAQVQKDGTLFKRQQLPISHEVQSAFTSTTQSGPRAFQHVQRPGHRLIVPILRPKNDTGAKALSKKQPSLAVPSEGTSPTASPALTPSSTVPITTKVLYCLLFEVFPIFLCLHCSTSWVLWISTG